MDEIARKKRHGTGKRLSLIHIWQKDFFMQPVFQIANWNLHTRKKQASQGGNVFPMRGKRCQNEEEL